jgi:hypothetical protein
VPYTQERRPAGPVRNRRERDMQVLRSIGVFLVLIAGTMSFCLVFFAAH